MARDFSIFPNELPNTAQFYREFSSSPDIPTRDPDEAMDALILEVAVNHGCSVRVAGGDNPLNDGGCDELNKCETARRRDSHTEPICSDRQRCLSPIDRLWVPLVGAGIFVMGTEAFEGVGLRWSMSDTTTTSAEDNEDTR